MCEGVNARTGGQHLRGRRGERSNNFDRFNTNEAVKCFA